jgi:S1-C subfamily serine protease
VRKFFIAFVLFIMLSVIPTTSLANQHLIDNITSETVALTGPNNETFCAGVWVANNHILTANHCIAAVAEYITEHQKHNDDMSKPVNLIGLDINYAVKSELDMSNKIDKIHKGKVSRIDAAHDLALIDVETDIPNHMVAKIATHQQLIGEPVSSIGHPSHLTWSYISGIITAIRPVVPGAASLKIYGPLIQISAPLWHGFSGGGIFNSNGELIGISSFICAAIPNVGFAIPWTEIQTFIL